MPTGTPEIVNALQSISHVRQYKHRNGIKKVKSFESHDIAINERIKNKASSVRKRLIKVLQYTVLYCLLCLLSLSSRKTRHSKSRLCL